jgi:hypothetical protein
LFPAPGTWNRNGVTTMGSGQPSLEARSGRVEFFDIWE